MSSQQIEELLPRQGLFALLRPDGSGNVRDCVSNLLRLAVCGVRSLLELGGNIGELFEGGLKIVGNLLGEDFGIGKVFAVF